MNALLTLFFILHIILGAVYSQPIFAAEVNISAVVPIVQCSDGIDNDGDGHVDYPNDPGCDAINDSDETNPPPPVTDFYTESIAPTIVFPLFAQAGATSRYQTEFPTAIGIPLGGKIVLTFPFGFSFAAECGTALSSLENSDLNGSSSGVVTIASLACDSAQRTVTITTGGASSQGGGTIRFLVQGVINSIQPRDYTTAGYVADIKTQNSFGSVLETKSSQPFFLAAPSSLIISGTVFHDNGAGLLGFANDGTQNGSEPGVSTVQICLGGAIGLQCATTNDSGAYSFGQLANGFYHIEILPLTSGNFSGGPFSRDITLSGQNAAGINFALRSSESAITVNISGIPPGTDLDVWAVNAYDSQAGGSVVREVLWNGSASRSVNLPVSDGRWDIRISPWASKGFSSTAGSVPNASFMLPQPQQVAVSGAGSYVASFALVTASRHVKGKIIDGANSPLPNVFVMARPAQFTAAMGSEVTTQSLVDGIFELHVQNGVYLIGAQIPGMPPGNELEVTVQNDTNNAAADQNSTADVYSGGILITNDGDGGKDNLIFTIPKGDRSISGRVLDALSNAIAYAQVSAQKVDSSGNLLDVQVGSPTDALGNFTLYVTDGAWRLRASAPGYGELNSLTVSVAGANLSGQNIQAAAAQFGTVSGRVTRGLGAVSGAFVNIYGADGKNSTVTDASGNYSLKVRSGTGYTIDGFVPGFGQLSTIMNVTVGSNSTLQNQDLAIGNHGTIRVTISGVTDAFIDVFDSSGKGNNTGSNTSGVYEIDVPAGMYTVAAGSVHYGSVGIQSGVAVAAGNTTSVSFTPSIAYTVSGAVLSSSAICKNGASIFLSDTTNGRALVSIADSSGAYSVSVPNGAYRLGAGKSGCIDSTEPSTVIVNGAPVSSGTNRTLTLANATVSGRITLAGSNIASDAKIIAKNANGNYVFADVDIAATAGNNYTLDLAPGTWSIHARSDGYESSWSTVTIASGESKSLHMSFTTIAGYTPAVLSSTLLVPSVGGVVRDVNIGNAFELTIPAGALGSSSVSGSIKTKITTALVTETPIAQVLGGKGVEITPQDANGQAITTISSSSGGVVVTLPYNQSDLAALGANEANLLLAVWSQEKHQWESLPTTVDTVNNTLTAAVTHFSVFAPIVSVGGGAPPIPAGLSASAASSSQINLSWTRVDGAAGYTIYRDISSGGLFARIGSDPTIPSGDTVLYSDTGLSAGTAYYYKISAVNVSGESAASSLASAVTTGYSGGTGGSGGSGGSGSGTYVPQSLPQTTVNFTGRAYPKSTVTLLKDAQIAATAIAAADANFSISASGISSGNYIFSVYSEDSKGIRSSLLTFPVSVTSGTTSSMSGIFIAPTIAIDKSEVKRGENIAIFGQSIPKAEITIAVNSEEEFFGKTIADTNGVYLYNFDTALLDMGRHFTKSKAALDGSISSFSKAISFTVGTKNIMTELPKAVAKGDLNNDTRVNLVDFSIAAFWYKRQGPPSTTDLNDDGKIDLIDFSIMAYYWTG